MNLDLRLGYAVPVGCALLLALGFPSARAIADPEARRLYRILQLASLFGAAVGAKLAAMWGDLGWPLVPLSSWTDIFSVGRSLPGGLLGGFLAAELLKPVVGYREPPNDRFAAVLPFSLAIGRVGCFVEGCCAGRPWNGPWALPDENGVLRHPAQLYELFFQLSIGGLFVFLLRRNKFSGRLFALYLVIYGVFRLLTELVRDTPRFALGASGYQLLALLLMVAGAWGLRRRLPSESEAIADKEMVHGG
jgi:phosphatidylglycerol:prolipoprotein diacylglycerol transferase